MTLLTLPVQTLAGEPTTLGELAGGDAVLLVNVASKCGLTPQYAQLEQLHEQTPGLTVVGVPCNQFGGQEPGTAEEIATFCSATYGVTFPVLAKTDVNGPGAHAAVRGAHRGAGRRGRGGRRAVELREVAAVAGRRARRALPAAGGADGARGHGRRTGAARRLSPLPLAWPSSTIAVVEPPDTPDEVVLPALEQQYEAAWQEWADSGDATLWEEVAADGLTWRADLSR